MEGKEENILQELNKKIFDLNEKNKCIIRQRDSILDQSLIIRKQRDSMIETNRELNEIIRILQNKLEKINHLKV